LNSSSPAWPAKDRRLADVVLDAVDEAQALVLGDGRDAARELLRAARMAWNARCNEIEGKPAELHRRLDRGGYSGIRQFSDRTLRQGCALLARVCPDLVVDVGGGRFCLPFTELKDPDAARSRRLEAWCRAKRDERRAQIRGEAELAKSDARKDANHTLQCCLLCKADVCLDDAHGRRGPIESDPALFIGRGMW
jgi:hypothetical protein